MKANRLCAVLLLLTCFLAGCGMSPEEKAAEEAVAEEWREKAEDNAVAYIEDKYGFEATVVDSESHTSDIFMSGEHPNALTTVYMKYQDKEFRVIASGVDDLEEALAESADDYQTEDIYDAFYEEVFSLTGVKPRDIRLETGAYLERDGADVFHNYFDGDNLMELIGEFPSECIVDIVGDADFDAMEVSDSELCGHDRLSILIVGYADEDAYNAAAIKDIQGIDDLYLDDYVYENAMYITDAVAWKDTEKISFDISVGQCDNFYYMAVGQDVSEYQVYPVEDMYEPAEWEGHGIVNAVRYSHAYNVEGVTEAFYVYYPTDDISSEVLSANLRMAMHRNGDDFYFVNNVEESGEYKVYGTNPHSDDYDVSFRFLYKEAE